MSEKQLAGWVKPALEFGPLVAFFILYSRIKESEFMIFGQSYEGFIVATAAFIPLLLISTAILWKLTGKLSQMQIVTAVLVVVFGGLSIWFNDERFFKMKPTMIYLLFAGVLGFGLLRGQSYLKSVMGEAIPLTDEGWMIFTKRFTLFFIGLAIANELVWRLMSSDAWVNFKTFGLTGLMIVFVMANSSLFSKYASDAGDV